MIVVDASAVLEILLNTAAAPLVAEYFFAPGETLHIPHLLDLEIAQVLRRYEASGELDSARGVQALEDLADLPLVRYPHDIFLLIPGRLPLRHRDYSSTILTTIPAGKFVMNW